MKRLIPSALMILFALPLAAQDRMNHNSCQNGFEAASELADPDNSQLNQQLRSIRVTSDRWCHIQTGSPGFDDLPFADLHWRMTDGARWTDDGIPPLALEIRIFGLDSEELDPNSPAGRPKLDADITLRQVPDAGLVVLESLELKNDAGDSLTLSGVFERVFLSSPSMMQVSMGSATFKAGLMVLTLDGTHEDPFGFEGNIEINGEEQAQVNGIFDLLSSVPDGVIDDASRAELTAFSRDLPKPVGTLEVSVASQRGLGLMQIGMSMYAGFASVIEGEGDNFAAELEILFDGLTLSADWSPTALLAD